ncbi:MAG TPA: Rrf2 family transcriptional regulator, partial [Abditibacteriaceae bacterium]
AKLTRQPEEINLLEVYRAVEPRDFFALHAQPPDPTCPVGGRIQPALGGTLNEAQRALEEVLENTTLAHVLQNLKTIPHSQE